MTTKFWKYLINGDGMAIRFVAEEDREWAEKKLEGDPCLLSYTAKPQFECPVFRCPVERVLQQLRRARGQLQRKEVNQMHDSVVTVACYPLLDGRDETDEEEIEEPSAPKDRATWLSKSSSASVEAIDEIGKLLKSIDPGVSINWANRQFVGLQVGNRSANFVAFAPKKKFLRVSARFLEDSEKWMNKLQRAGFHIVGGTPGKSVRFRTTKREVLSHRKLLTQVFAEGYHARTGKNSE
jgi:hypothetical protein